MSYLDTRELEDRIVELEETEQEHEDDPDENAPLDKDEQDELNDLRELRGSMSEWEDGATLIPEADWKTYAQELHADTTNVPSEYLDAWPLNCIDWDQAADELRSDYTSVQLGSVTYYYLAG